MSWSKLDDGFHGHPKVLEASLGALGLYALGLSYTARYSTDGKLSRTAVVMLGRGESALMLADELVRVKLWDTDGDGYVIHDFLDYNLSAKSLERERKAARKRMHAYRSRSPERTPNEQGTAPFVPDGTGRDGTGKTDTDKDCTRKRSSAELTAVFETRFWPIYPPRRGRREGKQPALAAWLALKPDEALETVLLEAVRAYATSTELPCDAERWLRKRRWEDETGIASTPPARARAFAAGGVRMRTVEETNARLAALGGPR